MKFEHLVQINDPLNPLIDPLDRNTLWQGLKRRAENPKEFVLALDGFEVLERSADSIRRALTFGRLVIRDEVRFVPQHQVRYEIEPGGEVPAATLTTTIEEPAPGELFVRFEYDVKPVMGAAPREAFYDEYVKQAYVEADIDSIVTIRRLAAQGVL
jgi:Domain of unknown function (DUF1857)